MSIVLPDNLFPAVGFFADTKSANPIVFTILIYSTNQKSPFYVAWFHQNRIEPITVYKDGEKWIDKRINTETINSKAIGTAIENYNPF